jgi:hypothetical protein
VGDKIALHFLAIILAPTLMAHTDVACIATGPFACEIGVAVDVEQDAAFLVAAWAFHPRYDGAFLKVGHHVAPSMFSAKCGRIALTIA